MHIAFVLGRTPQLAVREIERIATILPFQWSLSMLHPHVALLKSAEAKELGKPSFADSSLLLPELQKLQRRLGGTVRIAHVGGKVSRPQLREHLLEALQQLPVEGRLTFGISCFGGTIDPYKEAFALKNPLKEAGRSIRVIFPRGPQLNSAQIIGADLTGPNGIEILLIADGDQWLVGKTVTVQDISDYRSRDFDIPVPDPVSGMLSPKLAQTMINLGAGTDMQAWVYDPFCGNGRIPEEAALMGFKACGSDIKEEQVEASRKNAAWMAEKYDLTNIPEFWQADATQARPPHVVPAGEPYYVISEPYLGPPLRSPLASQEEARWLEELTSLYLTFFKNWSKVPKTQRPKSFVMVFPAATLRSGAKPLSVYTSLVDRLRELGYSSNQVSEYGRPDAFVVREIVRIDYNDSQSSR